MKLFFAMLSALGCFILAACSGLPQSMTLTPEPESMKAGVPVSSPLPTDRQAIPATDIESEEVSFSVVAEGDPVDGAGMDPVAVAWSPNDEAPAEFASFPDEALAALAQLENQDDSGLYLAIYGGIQPSNRYAVMIVSVTEHAGKIQVLYRVDGPPPGEGAATVMTHPYVIARLDAPEFQPADVIFVE